jgi:hypothetical protein
MISKTLKKYWWFFLSLLYLVVLIYRWYKSGIDLPVIGLFIAFVQTLVQNAETIKKLILRTYFWLANIQFRWKYSAEFTIPKSNANKINEKFFRTMIHKILNESGALKGTKEEIQYFTRKQGLEAVITFMPLGVNLVVTKQYGDFTDQIGEDDECEVMLLKVLGDTHVKYRKTKKVLDQFITSLFSELESNLDNISDKNFTLEIESGEQNHEYFKKLFIKGIESEEVSKFSLQKKPGRYTINASEKHIYVHSKYREDLVASVQNLLFKLSL